MAKINDYINLIADLLTDIKYDFHCNSVFQAYGNILIEIQSINRNHLGGVQKQTKGFKIEFMMLANRQKKKKENYFKKQH